MKKKIVLSAVLTLPVVLTTFISCGIGLVAAVWLGANFVTTFVFAVGVVFPVGVVFAVAFSPAPAVTAVAFAGAFVDAAFAGAPAFFSPTGEVVGFCASGIILTAIFAPAFVATVAKGEKISFSWLLPVYLVGGFGILFLCQYS